MYHPFRSITTGKEGNSDGVHQGDDNNDDNTQDKMSATQMDGEPIPESAPPKVADLKTPATPARIVDDKKNKTSDAKSAAAVEPTNPQESTPKRNKRLDFTARSIKSNKCDLKIVIAGGEDGEDPVTRWYQSSTMAEQSHYVDTMIESFLSENAAKPYEIRFDDIDEETWDLMMKFLDPVESRDMMAKDVLVVGEYYDHYDFPQGRKLCDKVLQEYFEGERSHEPEMDVEMLVDAVALAYKANLMKSYALGNRFLKDKLMAYKDKMYNNNNHRSNVVHAAPVPETSSEAGSPKRKSGKMFGR
ncbi:hypothetical protein ACA910_018974 [Epithemia clementina (nom. ined.)]